MLVYDICNVVSAAVSMQHVHCSEGGCRELPRALVGCDDMAPSLHALLPAQWLCSLNQSPLMFDTLDSFPDGVVPNAAHAAHAANSLVPRRSSLGVRPQNSVFNSPVQLMQPMQPMQHASSAGVRRNSALLCLFLCPRVPASFSVF